MNPLKVANTIKVFIDDWKTNKSELYSGQIIVKMTFALLLSNAVMLTSESAFSFFNNSFQLIHLFFVLVSFFYLFVALMVLKGGDISILFLLLSNVLIAIQLTCSFVFKSILSGSAHFGGGAPFGFDVFVWTIFPILGAKCLLTVVSIFTDGTTRFKEKIKPVKLKDAIKIESGLLGFFICFIVLSLLIPSMLFLLNNNLNSDCSMYKHGKEICEKNNAGVAGVSASYIKPTIIGIFFGSPLLPWAVFAILYVLLAYTISIAFLNSCKYSWLISLENKDEKSRSTPAVKNKGHGRRGIKGRQS